MAAYSDLTQFEVAKIIAVRAIGLSVGNAPPLIKHEGITRSEEIAELELEAGRTPMVLTRLYTDGSVEKIRLIELLPKLDDSTLSKKKKVEFYMKHKDKRKNITYQPDIQLEEE